MSVDTLVSIIDMVLQAIALGLAIMMAIYGTAANPLQLLSSRC